MRTRLAALLALMIAAGCTVGSGAVVKGAGPDDLLKLREGPGLNHKIIIGLPDGSIGDALYRAKITLSTGELFAWTFVIILLSAGFEKLFLALLDKAVARVLGEDVTKND